MPVRLTTWNVNGIRNPFGYQPWRESRTFQSMFDILQADIVIMQELKIQRKDLRDDMVLVPGWDCYFSLPKHKKGYSGVGIYTRNSVCAPIRAEEGILGVLCPPNSSTPYCEMPEDHHIGGYLSPEQLAAIPVDPPSLDSEGRCVVLEFPAFVLFGIYSPANSSGTRDDFRYGFLAALDTRVRNLVKIGKRVIVTGDLNVSRNELDTAKSEETIRKEGITYEEYMSGPNRRIFNQLLEGGKVFGERDEGRQDAVMWDICRAFHPTRKGMYTHWEQKVNARPGNFGSRIDFILCSLDMKAWFCESDIQEGLMGSDHCPVFAVIKDEISVGDAPASILDLLNPPGAIVNGQVRKAYDIKGVPALSAKLFPEFDKRRSIKDMFQRKTAVSKSAISQGAGYDDQVKEEQGLSAKGDTLSASATQAASQDETFSTPISAASRSPERKRSLESSTTSRPLKRTRSGAADSAIPNAGKGQQSLATFLKPKQVSAPTSAGEEGMRNPDRDVCDDQLRKSDVNDPSARCELQLRSSQATSSIEPSKLTTDSSQEHSPLQSARVTNLTKKKSPTKPAAVTVVDPEHFVDPFESKESWSKLFSKPIAPRCEHGEPCKVMKTKIKGFNSGREFWMCARHLGPTGDKERGTQWRCPTFIWASDWNGNSDRAV